MATSFSMNPLGLSVEKTLSDDYDLKSVYPIIGSSNIDPIGDSGDCSRITFGSETLSMFSSYELKRLSY